MPIEMNYSCRRDEDLGGGTWAWTRLGSGRGGENERCGDEQKALEVPRADSGVGVWMQAHGRNYLLTLRMSAVNASALIMHCYFHAALGAVVSGHEGHLCCRAYADHRGARPASAA